MTRVRDELIAKIKAQIAVGGWTQQKAAELSGLTQPRISDLLRGNMTPFRSMRWSASVPSWSGIRQ